MYTLAPISQYSGLSRDDLEKKIRKLEKEDPSIIDELLKQRRSIRESTRIIETALKLSHIGEYAS